MSAEKELVKRFKQLAPKYSLHNVFRDFTALGAYAFSNVLDKENYEERESKYMQIISKYEKEEAYVFKEMLHILIDGLNRDITDLLGETYMRLEISNKDQGQFFTSFDVAKLMSELMVNETIEEIEKNGFVTVNEPTVGAGVTIIALAESLKKRGYNYQKVMRVVAQDIDSSLVHMCYLQLSILGIDAVVMRGDTLAYKFDDFWYTPIHLLKIREERTSNNG